jgi:hypothetical protein
MVGQKCGDRDVCFWQRIKHSVSSNYRKWTVIIGRNAKIDPDYFHRQPTAHIKKHAAVSATNVENSPCGLGVTLHSLHQCGGVS